MRGLAEQVDDLRTLADRLQRDVERQREAWQGCGPVCVSFEAGFVGRVVQLVDALELLARDVECTEEDGDLRKRAFEGEEVAA